MLRLGPEEIIERYKLSVVSSFRWLGLHRNPQRHAWTQTGQIANDRLTNLAKFGYTQFPRAPSGNTTPGTLFRPRRSMTLGPVHQSGRRPPPPPRAQTDCRHRDGWFPLPRHHSPWDYIKRTIQLSMPATSRSARPFPASQPVSHTRPTSFKTPPVCGAKYNMRRIHQIRPSSIPRERTHIRSSVLRCVGPNASTPLNATAGTRWIRASPVPRTQRQIHRLLDFMATPTPKITYTK
jgi:hypothetical protein